MKLSVVIPAHNEEGCIANTVKALHDEPSKCVAKKCPSFGPYSANSS